MQVAAFVMARRLAARSGAELIAEDERKERGACAVATADDDSDAADHDPPPGWRKKANLRMYTILDKIF